MCSAPDESPFSQEDRCIICPAYPHRIGGDRIEHGLEIRRYATDDSQDLARGRLLFQRLRHLGVSTSQRPILLLKFGEQPDILDRDDCLVRKGLKERDLFVRERPWRGASDRNDADGNALSQHGDAESASIADRAAQGWILELRVEIGIWYVDDRAIENCPRCSKGSGWSRWEYALCRLKRLGGVVVLRDLMHQLAVEPEERAEESV